MRIRKTRQERRAIFDRVLSLGRYTGKGANGPVDLRYAHLCTISDDKVVRFEQFADTKLFRDAVGK